MVAAATGIASGMYIFQPFLREHGGKYEDLGPRDTPRSDSSLPHKKVVSPPSQTKAAVPNKDEQKKPS